MPATVRAARPHRRLLTGLLTGLVAGSLGGGSVATAQQGTSADSLRVRRDTSTVNRPAGPAPAARNPAARTDRFTPPLSPRRAFIFSAVLPGLGQSRLDRGSSGALFAAVELSALVMVRRSSADLREARRYRVDTLPGNFTVGASGTLTPRDRVIGRYDEDLVRTRRLHVEDWLAALAFNHLFAGADAFVAAQLWDLPIRLTAAPTANGPLFVATLRF